MNNSNQRFEVLDVQALDFGGSMIKEWSGEFRIVVQASPEPEAVVKGAAIYGREQLALRRAV